MSSLKSGLSFQAVDACDTESGNSEVWIISRGECGEILATLKIDQSRRDEIIETLSRVGRMAFKDGAHTPDQRAICDRMAVITDLLLRKNRDYGSSFRAPGTLSAADPAEKLIIRIEDKLARFRTLHAAHNAATPSVANETLQDTVTDIIGYFVLLGILLDEKGAPRPTGVDPNPGRAPGLDVVTGRELYDRALREYQAAFPPAIKTIQKDIKGEKP